MIFFKFFQVNLSITSTTQTNAPMDPWHWDSVAYTGVILLNDFDDFVGGELECMRMEKRRALKELARDLNLLRFQHQICQLHIEFTCRWPTKSSKESTRMSSTTKNRAE